MKDLRKPERKPKPTSPLSPSQSQLAEKYRYVAKSLAKPFKDLRPRDCDDLESEAILALVKAASSYDPGLGVSFQSFSRHRIIGALIDWCRLQAPHDSTVAMVDEPIVETSLSDFSEVEFEDYMKARFPALGILALDVLHGLAVEGKTIQEVSEMLRITTMDVIGIRLEAMRLLNRTTLPSV